MPGASFEKSVKGATKTKNAAPKSKYIEHILTATYNEAGVAEIFRTLQFRIRDSTWTIVYKALIVVHMMIREGSAGAALKYLSQNPKRLAITSISEFQAQGANIWRYSEYLVARANAYAETKTDFVRGGQGRLKRLAINKGLLRETEIVQKQIHALLKCDILMDEPENEISLTAFRLLTLDLLTLYSVMNEGTINVLEHYFEMSRPDSERALKIYKRFSAQTEEVVRFLRIARQYESATRLEIPNLKHASTDLSKLLEDDLNDPDFDQRRREYRSQKFGSSSVEKEKGLARSRSVSAPQKPKPTVQPAVPQSATPKLEVKISGPNLLDFFDDEPQPQQQQLSMPQQSPHQQFNPQNLQFKQQQQFQQTGFQPQPIGFNVQQNNFQQQPQQHFTPASDFGQQQTGFVGQFEQSNSNPFGQNQPQQQSQSLQSLQPNHSGSGFGGYAPQPQQHTFQTILSSIPQKSVPSFQQTMLTGSPAGGSRPNNPFRQSMLPPSTPENTSPTTTDTASLLKRQSTNPFAKRMTTQSPQFANGSPSPFSLQPPTQPLPQLPSQQEQQLLPLQPQPTGTNPFSRPQTAPDSQLQFSNTTRLTAASLLPNPTVSTNPFCQRAFIYQQTGQGWQAGPQAGPQATMGGLERLETVSVFPRPGQLA
ncbi:hypothetical protein GX48_07134 [Paracoccidioides brasiliensis]|nr:hypothetical protein GX48_07134 [Paracoccidioides brasiliensis]